jgi:hypothetical protein
MGVAGKEVAFMRRILLVLAAALFMVTVMALPACRPWLKSRHA